MPRLAYNENDRNLNIVHFMNEEIKTKKNWETLQFPMDRYTTLNIHFRDKNEKGDMISYDISFLCTRDDDFECSMLYLYNKIMDYTKDALKKMSNLSYNLPQYTVNNIYHEKFTINVYCSYNANISNK